MTTCNNCGYRHTSHRTILMLCPGTDGSRFDSGNGSDPMELCDGREDQSCLEHGCGFEPDRCPHGYAKTGPRIRCADCEVAELRNRIVAKILAGPYGRPMIRDLRSTCSHLKYRWEDCAGCAMIDMANDIEEMT